MFSLFFTFFCDSIVLSQIFTDVLSWFAQYISSLQNFAASFNRLCLRLPSRLKGRDIDLSPNDVFITAASVVEWE